MKIKIESIAINIFDKIDIGVYVYHLEDITDDHSLRMIYANRASFKFTGLPEEEMLGKTIDAIFPNLRELGIPQKYADVVRSQTAIVLEDVFYKDNRVIENWFAVKAFPLPENCVAIIFENISERKNAELANKKLIDELQKALSEIKTLRGLIPICMDCKQIRDVEGLWIQIDKYLQEHTSAEFSHSICDACLKKRYPDIAY